MNQTEVGFVKSVKKFLAHLDGFPTVKVNDIVENDQGIRGWVSALLSDCVEVLLVDEGNIQPGQIFRLTGNRLTVPVGQFLIGRAINPLGIPIDGKGPISKTKTTPELDIDQPALGIEHREFIATQFDTGILLVDSIVPLGRGQRELILGDAHSGKTEFLMNTIVNQKQTGVICVYASIGKPISEVRNLLDTLKKNNAEGHTVVIAATSSDPAPLIFLTPQTAFTVAEYFQRQGNDVLLILDDMGIHAKIHREISLLGDRPPGRESYPGDIFYQHAHLLERAGNFKPDSSRPAGQSRRGGGSITALPVMELNLNDFTTYIPTNLMGMTDGHMLFKSSLHLQGQRPAVDISLSVSRVGSQTQNRMHNKLATKVKQVLAEAAQLETVSRFSFELPMTTQLTLKQKDQINELIKHPSLSYIPKEVQMIILSLPFTNFFRVTDKDFVQKNKDRIIASLLIDKELINASKMVTTLKNEEEFIKFVETVVTPRLQRLTAPPARIVKPVAAPPPPPVLKKESFTDKIDHLLHKQVGKGGK